MSSFEEFDGWWADYPLSEFRDINALDIQAAWNAGLAHQTKDIAELEVALDCMTDAAAELQDKLNSADNRIEDLKKSQEWVSVSERGPNPNLVNEHNVLGFNGSYCFECEFDDGFWCNIGGDEMTHWMPLPLPPQQKGES